MSLRKKQSKFAHMVALLILEAERRGYEVTLGDAFRDERVHGKWGEKKAYGEIYSCHKVRLAIDLNLFKDGVWLQSTEDHRPLGEWWKSQGPEFRWGGDFKDGNHYSFEHEGKA